MRDEEVGMKGGCGDCGDCMDGRDIICNHSVAVAHLLRHRD